MKKEVFLYCNKCPNFDDFSAFLELGDDVINHAKQKYSQKNSQILSLFAVKVLKKIASEHLNLPFEFSYLKSGKPILKGASVSISHSQNTVLVLASKREDLRLGGDIEYIDDSRNLDFLKRFGGEFLNANNLESYILHVKREATVKAFDGRYFDKNLPEFLGVNKVIKIDNENFAFAVYGEDIKIIEVNYENNV